MTKTLLALVLCIAAMGTAEAQRTKKKPPAKPAAPPIAAPAAPAADPPAAPTPVPVAAPEQPKVGATVTGTKKEKTIDFTAMGIEGKVLTPQLLYLLGRIKVELEKATLESRSFVPELVRSVDEGGL